MCEKEKDQGVAMVQSESDWSEHEASSPHVNRVESSNSSIKKDKTHVTPHRSESSKSPLAVVEEQLGSMTKSAELT